eukprot:1161628-Pelagomonas_calceolata.AAC.23
MPCNYAVRNTGRHAVEHTVVLRVQSRQAVHASVASSQWMPQAVSHYYHWQSATAKGSSKALSYERGVHVSSPKAHALLLLEPHWSELYLKFPDNKQPKDAIQPDLDMLRTHPSLCDTSRSYRPCARPCLHFNSREQKSISLTQLLKFARNPAMSSTHSITLSKRVKGSKSLKEDCSSPQSADGSRLLASRPAAATAVGATAIVAPSVWVSCKAN